MFHAGGTSATTYVYRIMKPEHLFAVALTGQRAAITPYYSAKRLN